MTLMKELFLGASAQVEQFSLADLQVQNDARLRDADSERTDVSGDTGKGSDGMLQPPQDLHLAVSKKRD